MKQNREEEEDGKVEKQKQPIGEQIDCGTAAGICVRHFPQQTTLVARVRHHYSPGLRPKRKRRTSGGTSIQSKELAAAKCRIKYFVFSGVFASSFTLLLLCLSGNLINRPVPSGNGSTGKTALRFLLSDRAERNAEALFDKQMHQMQTSLANFAAPAVSPVRANMFMLAEQQHSNGMDANRRSPSPQRQSAGAPQNQQWAPSHNAQMPPEATTSTAGEDPSLMDYDAIDAYWRWDIDQEKGVLPLTMTPHQAANGPFGVFRATAEEQLYERDIQLLTEKSLLPPQMEQQQHIDSSIPNEDSLLDWAAEWSAAYQLGKWELPSPPVPTTSDGEKNDWQRLEELTYLANIPVDFEGGPQVLTVEEEQIARAWEESAPVQQLCSIHPELLFNDVSLTQAMTNRRGSSEGISREQSAEQDGQQQYDVNDDQQEDEEVLHSPPFTLLSLQRQNDSEEPRMRSPPNNSTEEILRDLTNAVPVLNSIEQRHRLEQEARELYTLNALSTVTIGPSGERVEYDEDGHYYDEQLVGSLSPLARSGLSSSVGAHWSAFEGQQQQDSARCSSTASSSGFGSSGLDAFSSSALDEESRDRWSVQTESTSSPYAYRFGNKLVPEEKQTRKTRRNAAASGAIVKTRRGRKNANTKAESFEDEEENAIRFISKKSPISASSYEGQFPPIKSKRGRKSKDNSLVHEHNLPYSPEQLAAMPYREYSALMHDNTLSTEKKALIKKIRRRGRNKLAARKCRDKRLSALEGTESIKEESEIEEDEEGIWTSNALPPVDPSGISLFPSTSSAPMPIPSMRRPNKFGRTHQQRAIRVEV